MTRKAREISVALRLARWAEALPSVKVGRRILKSMRWLVRIEAGHHPFVNERNTGSH